MKKNGKQKKRGKGKKDLIPAKEDAGEAHHQSTQKTEIREHPILCDCRVILECCPPPTPHPLPLLMLLPSFFLAQTSRGTHLFAQKINF